MSKVKVAVLRGGPSSKYDISLKSGHEVLSYLREMPEKYDPIDIFISKDGDWHKFGIVEEPHQALQHVDVVWNGLHGAYGEDGQVQRLLESMNVPSLDLFNSQKFYILFDPPISDKTIEYNMQKLSYFLQSNNKIVYAACAQEEGCPNDLPIKSCKDYSFYFKQANQSKAYIQDNCYVIEGNGEEITKITDKVDLKLVGL